MSDPGVTGNSNETNSLEHDSTDVYTKRVMLYGYDAVTMKKVRVVVNANGQLVSDAATTPTIITKELTTASTEYTVTLPTNCKAFSAKLRSQGSPFTFAFTPSSASYMTVPANSGISYEGINIPVGYLYVKSTAATMTLEIIAWT
jgi:hypothetical protein